ncbi:hypothetical protein D3C79_998660 [compost metagenome]
MQQQAYLITALVAKIGGGLVVDVAEFIDRLEYPLAGMFRNSSLVTQGHGDGGGRYPQMAGNIGNGHIAHEVSPVMVLAVKIYRLTLLT